MMKRVTGEVTGDLDISPVQAGYRIITQIIYFLVLRK